MTMYVLDPPPLHQAGVLTRLVMCIVAPPTATSVTKWRLHIDLGAFKDLEIFNSGQSTTAFANLHTLTVYLETL